MQPGPASNAPILKKNTSSFRSGLALLLVDAVAIMLCFGGGYFIVNTIGDMFINFRSFVTYWLYLPVFICVFYAVKLYPGIMLPPADEVRRIALCCAGLFAGIALSVVVETGYRKAVQARYLYEFFLSVVVETGYRKATSLALLLAIPIAILLIPVMREIARGFFSRFSWWGVGVVVYCNGHEGASVIDRLLRRPDLGYRPVLIVNLGSTPVESYRGIPVAAPSAETHQLIRKWGYKTAIIVESPLIDIEEKLGYMLKNQYRYTVLVPHIKMSTIALSVRDLGGVLGFASTHNLTKRANLFLKRFIDVSICVIFTPLVLLFSLFFAALVKLSSPGPVFYGQKRLGLNGKKFTAWKFRTMAVNAEEKLQDLLRDNPALKAQWDEKQKLDNDPRVTPTGKILRTTSMDELPQLWNILVGQMSLVGPRPPSIDEFEKRFTVYKDKARFLLSVRPGLSGLWQVSGRSETSYEDRMMMDTYYIENWSIWLDIWVLIKTVGAVIRKRGAV